MAAARGGNRRGGPAGAARRRGNGALGAAVTAFVALIAGEVLWLALTADETMSEMRRLASGGGPMVSLALPPRPMPEATAGAEGAGGGAMTGDESPEAPPETPPETHPGTRPQAHPATQPEMAGAGSEAGHAGPVVSGAEPQRLTGDAPWQRYSQPFDRTDPRPRIGIIVTHLGLAEAITAQAIDRLPAAVTLAFSAYAADLDRWLPEASADGHETLLMVPMEPDDYPADDPGPHTLQTSVGPEVNLERLGWVLGRAEGYVGVMDTYGGRFTASAAGMEPVLETLADRGLAYVDSRASPRSVGVDLAAGLGMPRAAVDIRLDLRATPDALDIRLLQLETLARQTGVAIAATEAYPLILDRLQLWAEGLAGKGLTLAPITAVLQARP